MIYVTVEKAAELLGLTKHAIYSRIKRHEWIQDVHFRKKGRRLFINMPAVHKWIEQE